MRSLMNGSLSIRSFETFALPIKVFSAIEDTTPKSHFLHNKCKTQINLIPRCPECKEMITHEDILEGYVVPDSKELAILTREEILALNTVPKTIEILEFVPLSQFDLMRPTGAAYYLGVNGEDSTLYRLFYKAIAVKQVFAIAFWSYRNRERLAIIRPDPHGVLVLQPIYHDSEIRTVDEIPVPNKKDLDSDYVKMVMQMVDVKTTTNVKWSKYRDLYIEKLTNLLASRTKVGKMRGKPSPKKNNVVDLLASLVQPAKAAKPKRTRARKTRRSNV